MRIRLARLQIAHLVDKFVLFLIIFDLVFIDADFQGVATYFKEAKRLVRKGGVIVSPRSPERRGPNANPDDVNNS